jgi:K+-transporting ATPase ATPase C chain
MRRDLISSIVAVLAFTVLLGLAYPLVITGVAQVAFPGRADGSLIMRDGTIVGSRLIGQDFTGRPRYFQSRPSATDYSAAATGFSNAGPNSAELRDDIRTRARAYLRREGRDNPGLTLAGVPADAAQTSASGIDPQISVRNARIQAARVARVRRLPKQRVLDLVDRYTEGRGLGVFGEPGVNVLQLNLALDL